MNPLHKLRLLSSTLYRRARPLIFPQTLYSRAYPDPQAALSLFEGEWVSQLPGFQSGGQAGLFSQDERPRWMAKAAGGIEGRRILELGPLEGGHTYQLEQMGAEVTGIEANALAFQRCLIVKNLYQLKAKLLLGDFVKYLAETQDRFDIVLASGVLYHMRTPARLVQDMCRVADQVFLWTHYFDAAVIEADSKLRRSFASGRTQTEDVAGVPITSHERRYNSGWLTYFQPGFCGGMDVGTYWLELADLRKCFDLQGFDVTACETAVSEHGPHLTLMARRRPAATSEGASTPA